MCLCLQFARATIIDDFGHHTFKCGPSSRSSDYCFVLSVQGETSSCHSCFVEVVDFDASLQNLESNSEGTDSETKISKSGPKMGAIVISDDTQRHDVETLSTSVGDKELPGHGSIDDNGENAVEIKELHKGVVMDKNGAEGDQQPNWDEESPNITSQGTH
ncbi:hypothetical protein VKT23_008651 [Stygiomarasmius scandens]|uniref:Uncharacterized protein n=1 Tax=Marasmiellus scandens TaxID=2682957 RepID=A0ABR1JJK5_9AGAR